MHKLYYLKNTVVQAVKHIFTTHFLLDSRYFFFEKI